MARTNRSTRVYFSHEGAERVRVYFRLNPIAIRVQQGNKGAVVDTLGGYFREVMFSENPEHNGLMLPDLTIEAETGVAYRAELEKLAWIWKHHADKKEDGSPADTYFYDFIRDDEYQGVKRDANRAYKIEILNFAWDDSVQDPYRIRFSFRCKILKDMLAQLDDAARKRKLKLKEAAKGELEGALGKDKSGGVVLDSGVGGLNIGLNEPILSGIPIVGGPATDYRNSPLNIGGQATMMQNTLSFLPSSMQQGPVGQILNAVLQQSGLGNNQVLQKVQQLGQSVFNRQQPIYPKGSPEQILSLVTAISQVLGVGLPNIPAPIGTILQSGNWVAPSRDTPEGVAHLQLRQMDFSGDNRPAIAPVNSLSDIKIKI